MARKIDVTETLTVESIGFEGKSIARKDGLVYFVDKGVPGDTVVARVRKKKRSYMLAEIESMITPS